MQIPEDLKEHYEICGKYQSSHLMLCHQLIERIATAEQTIAELRAEVALLRIRNSGDLLDAYENNAASIKGEDNAGTN